MLQVTSLGKSGTELNEIQECIPVGCVPPVSVAFSGRTTPEQTLTPAHTAPSHTPSGPNSFIFLQFLGTFGKIVCWCPPESWRPHLGEILDPPLDGSLITLNNLKMGYPARPNLLNL